MKRFIYITLIICSIASLTYGCNVVPKSVQYQREEEKIIGSTDEINPLVEEVQVALSALGYNTGNKDGRMGQETRDAIKEFQDSIGIKSTGYIDKTTWMQIEDARRASEERGLKKSYTIDVKSAYLEGKGATPTGFKPTTKEIQTALKNAGFDPGTIDGKMGPKTRQAVKEFQKTKGLNPDGVVGPKTWAELGKYLKK